MNQKQFNKTLARIEIEVDAAVNRKIPLAAANVAAALFRQNFEDEGFFGDKWEEVKRRQDDNVTGTNAERPILAGRTGNLRRSLRYAVSNGGTVVYSDLPYSAAHNDGTTTAGRGRRTVIPKRQFIGDHETVRAAIRDKINQILNAILKK